MPTFVLVVLTLASTFLTACSTNMTLDLERRHTHNGVSGTEKSGTVVYNPHGVETLVNQRRAEALMRIHDWCQPAPYEITKEETVEPEVREPGYNGEAKKLFIKTLRFVDFVCKGQQQL